jgi:hypothetical protein
MTTNSLATAVVSSRLHLALRPRRILIRLGLQGFGSHDQKRPRHAIYFETGSTNY